MRDVVRGYTLAITQGEPGEVYNLGAGQAFTIRALLDTLIRYSGREDRGGPGSCPRPQGCIESIVADCTKLRACTGWRPEIAFEQSLHDVLDYWREQVRTGAGDPTPLGLRIQRDT